MLSKQRQLHDEIHPDYSTYNFICSRLDSESAEVGTTHDPSPTRKSRR